VADFTEIRNKRGNTAQFLCSIWGSSASDVFTVGYKGTILHYDGKAWSNVPTGTMKDLEGVWGSSPSNIFAVGVNGTILHYNP
jgi:photosystem II stability/assembly factor-like uncharacterized protein